MWAACRTGTPRLARHGRACAHGSRFFDIYDVRMSGRFQCVEVWKEAAYARPFGSNWVQRRRRWWLIHAKTGFGDVIQKNSQERVRESLCVCVKESERLTQYRPLTCIFWGRRMYATWKNRYTTTRLDRFALIIKIVLVSCMSQLIESWEAWKTFIFGFTINVSF